MVPSEPATELKIIDNKAGTGQAIVAHDTVTVQYVGCGQITAKQFDASWDSGQAATFSIDQVIKGWTQGLVGMKIGGQRTLVIPGELAYGASPTSPDIKPDETLVFVIDLVAIKQAADPAVLEAINKRGKPTVKVPDTAATELKITDDVAGTGAEVKAHDSVTVHYVGVGQVSKKQFDASWDRGKTIDFSIDGVIKGWTQGLLGMKVGGRRTLVIPGSLAYGANPPSTDIQANETLVFVIDLVAIA